jgi:hypothetical protein
MKNLFILIFSIVLCNACSKQKNEQPIPTIVQQQELTATNATATETGCTTTNCPSDIDIRNIYGCDQYGNPCWSLSSEIAAALNEIETARRVKKPTNVVSEDLVILAFTNTKFVLKPVSPTVVNYQIVDALDPKTVLYDTNLSKISENTFYRGGDAKLSVSASALLNYSKNKTVANRRIVVKQSVDQFNITSYLK